MLQGFAFNVACRLDMADFDHLNAEQTRAVMEGIATLLAAQNMASGRLAAVKPQSKADSVCGPPGANDDQA